jgi:hypothetical protein
MRWIAFGLFVASLMVAPFKESDLLGYHLMLFGVVGWLDFQLFFAMPWLANVFFLATYLFRLRQSRWVTVSLAWICAGFAFFITELPGAEDTETLEVTRALGFYLWYASFVLLLLDAVLGRWGVWPPPISK